MIGEITLAFDTLTAAAAELGYSIQVYPVMEIACSVVLMHKHLESSVVVLVNHNYN